MLAFTTCRTSIHVSKNPFLHSWRKGHLFFRGCHPYLSVLGPRKRRWWPFLQMISQTKSSEFQQLNHNIIIRERERERELGQACRWPWFPPPSLAVYLSLTEMEKETFIWTPYNSLSLLLSLNHSHEELDGDRLSGCSFSHVREGQRWRWPMTWPTLGDMALLVRHANKSFKWWHRLSSFQLIIIYQNLSGNLPVKQNRSWITILN